MSRNRTKTAITRKSLSSRLANDAHRANNPLALQHKLAPAPSLIKLVLDGEITWHQSKSLAKSHAFKETGIKSYEVYDATGQLVDRGITYGIAHASIHREYIALQCGDKVRKQIVPHTPRGAKHIDKHKGRRGDKSQGTRGDAILYSETYHIGHNIKGVMPHKIRLSEDSRTLSQLDMGMGAGQLSNPFIDNAESNAEVLRLVSSGKLNIDRAKESRKRLDNAPARLVVSDNLMAIEQPLIDGRLNRAVSPELIAEYSLYCASLNRTAKASEMMPGRPHRGIALNVRGDFHESRRASRSNAQVYRRAMYLASYSPLFAELYGPLF